MSLHLLFYVFHDLYNLKALFLAPTGALYCWLTGQRDTKHLEGSISYRSQMVRLKRCESSSFQTRSFSFLCIFLCYSFNDCPGHEDAVMWLCTETLSHSKHRQWGQSWTWLCLTGLREHSPHGKNEGFTCLCFYVCVFMQLNDPCWNSVHVLGPVFKKKKKKLTHGFPLLLLTSIKLLCDHIVLLWFGILSNDSLQTQCLCTVL